MIIYSWNINGYHTCDKYGSLSKIIKLSPDFICLQEVKTSNPLYMNNLFTFNYEQYYNFSSNKGHNGVFIYSKHKASNCFTEIGLTRFDSEGRFICLEFPTYYLINVYMPHGGRNKKNYEYKLETYDKLIEYLKKLKNKAVIIVGDFNIAYSNLDLERYKNNRNNTMFTEAERRKFHELLNLGYVDVFRDKYPNARKYTWWPYAYNARKRNMGWRIDYCLVSLAFYSRIKCIKILNELLGSDHCPICVNIII